MWLPISVNTQLSYSNPSANCIGIDYNSGRVYSTARAERILAKHKSEGKA